MRLSVYSYAAVREGNVGNVTIFIYIVVFKLIPKVAKGKYFIILLYPMSH